MHFVHYHHLVGKKAPDAVKVDRDAGVTITVIFDPSDVIIEGIKVLHQSACPGIFNLTLSTAVVHQLEFIDAKSNKISDVGRGWIAQAGVEFDALPFRRVVAGGSNDQPRYFIGWNHLGFIKCQGWRGHVARADMHLKAIGKAGFRGPLGDQVRVAAGVTPNDDHFPREIFSANESRHVFIIQKVTHCLHDLAGTGFSEIKAHLPRTPEVPKRRYLRS